MNSSLVLEHVGSGDILYLSVPPHCRGYVVNSISCMPVFLLSMNGNLSRIPLWLVQRPADNLCGDNLDSFIGTLYSTYQDLLTVPLSRQGYSLMQ